MHPYLNMTTKKVQSLNLKSASKRVHDVRVKNLERLDLIPSGVFASTEQI